MAKHVVPLMKAKKSGSIVNVGSISSFIAQPGFVPYNTTKVKSLHPVSSTPSLIY
jgi:short-subunit dehydrogenase